MISTGHVMAKGWLRIFDPITQQTLVEKTNAINYENMSVALAQSLSNSNTGFVYEMAFGNGGSAVDTTGVITYLPPNTLGQNADLYNQTYTKVVDNGSTGNSDPTRNFTTWSHTPGTTYSDVLISCLLDYGEPAGQQAFDNSTNFDGEFVFDELGLKAYQGQSASPILLTHVIFHPVQKSLNRQIQIDYTVRISTLTNLTGA